MRPELARMPRGAPRRRWPAAAQLGRRPGTQGVARVEAAFDPAEAKPGQTVTFTLTVQLNDGYHTYPLEQDDKAAAGQVNKLAVPGPRGGDLRRRGGRPGRVQDRRPSRNSGSRRCGSTCRGKVVYERKAVVVPEGGGRAGDGQVPAFRLNVCDKNNCFPPKTLTPEATLKVLDGPAVAVEPGSRPRSARRAGCKSNRLTPGALLSEGTEEGDGKRGLPAVLSPPLPSERWPGGQSLRPETCPCASSPPPLVALLAAGPAAADSFADVADPRR